MKKRVFALAMAAVMGLSMSATVFAEAEVANKDKPLVWFNRQPSNSSTGELDWLH